MTRNTPFTAATTFDAPGEAQGGVTHPPAAAVAPIE
jgi:hypothetical protein